MSFKNKCKLYFICLAIANMHHAKASSNVCNRKQESSLLGNAFSAYLKFSVIAI